MMSLIAITKAITASAVELKAVKIKHTLHKFKGVIKVCFKGKHKPVSVGLK